MTDSMKLLLGRPKAQRTDLSLEIIIVIGLGLVAFFLVKKFLSKIFPTIDEQLENIIPIVAAIGVMALGFWLTNL